VRRVAVLCLFLLVPGCSPTYVARAGYEEAKILWRRQPIAEMLQDPSLDADTRDKLTLVLQVREFARDTLHLRVGGCYSSFARVDAHQVVHVVTAAYRDRLEPYTWWFPIVGRVPYKGYFSEAAAREEAEELEGQGFDTSIGPSVAFSTLGWFDDPLLSTLLRYDRVALADTVIHELLHNTAYPAGHAAFNESFANFVGHRGAILFFATQDNAELQASAQAGWDAALTFSDFLVRFIDRLRAAYAAGITSAQRDDLFTAAQTECRQLPLQGRYRGFTEERLNNAVILHTRMYNDRLALFEAVYRQVGADLRRTIAAVIDAVQQHPGDPFDALGALPR
jgi:predicted aminopeptidase